MAIWIFKIFWNTNVPDNLNFSLKYFSACAMGLVHQRSDKCVEKLIEIEESQTDEYEKFEKKCPEGLENVYDIGFCVKVSWGL